MVWTLARRGPWEDRQLSLDKQAPAAPDVGLGRGPRSLSPLRRSVRRIRRGVAAGGVLLLVVLAGSSLLISRADAQQRDSLAARFDTRQATAAHFIEAYVAQVFQREVVLAGRSLSGAPDGEGFARLASDQGFDAAVLLDADGRLLASQPPNPAAAGQDLTVRYAHLRSAVKGGAAVSGVVPSAVRGVPVVAFAIPFQTPSGRRVFSGAYVVESTPLGPFVRDAAPFRSAHVLVVDQAGRVVTGSGEGDAGQPLEAVAPALAAVQDSSAYIGSGRGRQYVTQSTVEGTSWRLLFAVNTDELFGSLHTSARWVPWLVLGGTGLLGLLTLAVLYRYLLQRARLQEREGRQRAILDTAGDAFVGMDDAGRITDWNAAATRLLGWTEAEAVGRALVGLVVPPEDRQAHSAAVGRFLSSGLTSLPSTAVRVQALKKDGGRADVEFSPSRLPWESGWHFHAFLRDIAGQLEHDRQLRLLALTDGLTGLLNRRSVLERLDQALARAKRQARPVAVLFIDVDQFKAVNDRHGHAAGDAVLVAVGVRLRAIFRAEDSVARLGGDEFLVVCEDQRSRAEATVLAERTRAALAQPYQVSGQALHVTASVGLAVADGAATAEILLARADAQMYDVKASRQAFTEIVAPCTP
jgi:diguanylate cyclase (GGDEF)-like protein/PAS domain S-box-containing protein